MKVPHTQKKERNIYEKGDSKCKVMNQTKLRWWWIKVKIN